MRRALVAAALVAAVGYITTDQASAPAAPAARPVMDLAEVTTTTGPPPAPPSTTTTHPPSPTTTTTTAPPPPPEPEPAPPPSEPVRATGACGGWEATIAAHFPADQVAKACDVMMCESGGNPSAQNPSGASGLFQVMPGWADEYQSVTGLPYYDGRFDGPANIRFAAWLQGTDGWGHWVCA